MVVCVVVLQEAKPQQRYAVRVSLFDLPYKQFFGRTWTGYPVTAKDAPGNKVKFPYAQVRQCDDELHLYVPNELKLLRNVVMIDSNVTDT